jgi:hypothetical protein
MNKCKDCNKILGDNIAKRCCSCEMKRKWKLGILKSRTGKEHHLFKNGLWSKINKHYCIDCKKEIVRGHLRCTVCSKLGKNNPNFGNHILSKKFKGKNNPSWKGGISRLPYAFEFTEELKEKIRKRDKYRCRICNKTQKESLLKSGKKLCIHHIDYNKKNFKEKNLISLCNSCHAKTNEHRKFWIRLIKNLIKEL